MSEIVWLVLQFAAQNCFGCYSKLNLDSEFHAKVASHFPHKIKNTICIEYYIIIIAIQNFMPKLLLISLIKLRTLYAWNITL